MTEGAVWGDAADLIDIMRVTSVGDGHYTGRGHADTARPVVEGSQMLGQAIIAAGHEVPDRRVVSAHMVFLRAADARRPLDFEVDTITGGRTFTALGVRVMQDDKLR